MAKDVDVNEIIKILERITRGYINLAADYGWMTAGKSPKVVAAKELINKLKERNGKEKNM